jgi:hypothetical protein
MEERTENIRNVREFIAEHIGDDETLQMFIEERETVPLESLLEENCDTSLLLNKESFSKVQNMFLLHFLEGIYQRNVISPTEAYRFTDPPITIPRLNCKFPPKTANKTKLYLTFLLHAQYNDTN